MITPAEIKYKAINLYESFISSWLNEEVFFPKEIPSNKGKSTDKYGELNKNITLLMGSSKNQTGTGYLIVFRSSNTRKHGSQSLPEKIVFETEDDFLSFIDRKNDFLNFKEKGFFIIKVIPSLKSWINDNISYVRMNDNWADLLKVCLYFQHNTCSNMYVRELPIEIHTKFIENNITVLKSLLDYLLPENVRNKSESSFEKRYCLRYDEPLIRFRLLDKLIAQKQWQSIYDLSIPVSSFAEINIDCSNVFIIENKMTFLAFPETADSIAIWGRGFNVELLRNINWLNSKNIYYWGDIDIHGLQILAQLRKYFSNVNSLLMDYDTYKNFIEFAVEDPNFGERKLLNLTDSEKEIFEIICTTKEKSRLEQEKITQKYLLEVLRSNSFVIKD